MDETRQPRRIQSVDRAFDILEVLRDSEGATVTEIADQVALSPGSVHTYLSTMVDRGYVRHVDGEYRLGLFFLPMGEYVRSHFSVYEAGKPVLDDLAAETGEAAHLVVESCGREIPVYEQFGSDAVGIQLYVENKTVPRQNLHCSAAGKAILAFLDDDRVDEILSDYDFAQRTPSTITDEAALRDELASVRESGVAYNDEEQIPGIRAVGAPIVSDGTVRGAISLSAPASRLKGETFVSELPDRARQATNIIEVNMQSP